MMLRKLLSETGVKIVVYVCNYETRYGAFTDDNEFLCDLTKQDVLDYIEFLERKDVE